SADASVRTEPFVGDDGSRWTVTTPVSELRTWPPWGLLDREQGLTLTGDGACWFTALGMSPPAATRRPLARSCLDWTGRRPHLAGAAGAAPCSLTRHPEN